MSSNTQTIDTTTFDTVVLGADRPVLVDFHADWCQPCRLLGPTIDAIAETFDGRALIGNVDIDANAELAERYEIRSIPTVLLFIGGEIVERFVGVQPRASYEDALNAALGRLAA